MPTHSTLICSLGSIHADPRSLARSLADMVTICEDIYPRDDVERCVVTDVLGARAHTAVSEIADRATETV